MARGPAGHIERLPSGSWRVKVYAGIDPLTGREIRLRRTCKTERAAQIELGKLLEQVDPRQQVFFFKILKETSPDSLQHFAPLYYGFMSEFSELLFT